MLLIIINIDKQIIYFNIYGVTLPDSIIPINVDMNIGILYLSILLVHKKKAILKGAIKPIKIDLLNKKPIKLNIIILKFIFSIFIIFSAIIFIAIIVAIILRF